jgi:membrane protease YdiL (CAAX protease family)
MKTTLIILALLTGYLWGVVPLVGVAHGIGALAILAALAFCAWDNRREGGPWGFQRQALAPGLRWALGMTLPAVLLLLAAGWGLGTVQPRDHMILWFGLLVLWALVQLLQTVVFREAKESFGRRAAFLVAAGFFALIHVPNPFLTPVTFLAGLGWCWLYERNPNLIPIALSHAAASFTALIALGPRITGGMHVGYSYFLAHGSFF